MEFTGERFVPQCQGEIAAEHYHRYFFASGFVAGKRVLDIASGEGYGTHILAQCAAHVTGVDISPEAVTSATRQYAGDSVAFLQGSAAAIPLPDAAVDVAVSFETLEHLPEQEDMISEIRRVLRQDGLLIISTPNKPIYSKKGHNPFHVKELCREEFVALLKSQFSHVSLLGQKAMYGSLLGDAGGETFLLRQRAGGDAAERLPFTDQARYFIAVAGNGPLPHADVTFLEYPLEKSDLAMSLRNSLTELQGIHAALQNSHDALKSSHNAAQARREAVEAAYTAVLASRSWRATAPLRRLRHLLKGKRSKS